MKRILSVTVSMLLASTTAFAGGMPQPVQSASGLGVANAFVATANDASALAYNPAGIAWQSGVSVLGGFSDPYRDSSVKLAGGIGPNEGSEAFGGSIYASWAPLDSSWAAGIGFAPLYQVNNEWSLAFPTAGVSKINVDRTTFDAVYAVNSSLAVGFGGDWYFTRVNFSQGVNSFKGNDWGSFGGHVSVKWNPMPAWSTGLMVRSGSKITISGGTNNKLSFKLPDEVSAGVAHDFADVWRLELDAKWTRWSSLKNLNVVGLNPQTNNLNLKDTITVMAGLTWTWRPNSQIRAGYAYDQGANKAAGFNPVLADQDGHQLTVGAGGDYSGLHFDVAYSYTYYTKRTATDAFAGTYRDRRQFLSMSVSSRFE
ncbi:outer membrane protein transport protein [Mariprofundus micogutta]|uniref:Outer membrane protein transport protein n=1 Tax=Mariprofundus micogutta TaxID=1921010 RepID=A0A1L8CPA2_9PROT|nr:outer membrane protein transport protein [Mariprofundus micogutta]GAV20713.1 outer membrane protein transport protein [Mariprofundus micogutta]